MRVFIRPRKASMSQMFRRANQTKNVLQAQGRAATIHNSGGVSIFYAKGKRK